jgi:hypothetical protein
MEQESLDHRERRLMALGEAIEKFGQILAKLVDRKVVPCSLTEWAEWDPEHEKRRIGRHETETHLVSTVFLGLNHGWIGLDIRPIWFETMIFDKTQRHELEVGGKLTGTWSIGETIYEERYSTLEEAEQGHQAAIAWLKERIRSVGNTIDRSGPYSNPID